MPDSTDSSSLSTHLLEEDTAALMSFYDALKEGRQRSYAFILPRLFVAAKSLVNAIVSANLPNPDAAAGLAIGTLLQQLALGIVKGGTVSIEAFIAELNKQNKYDKIGPLVNQALVFSTVIGLPTAISFYYSEALLESIGIEEGVAEEAGKFLRAFSYGFLPLCWTMVDQAYLLSIDRKWSPAMLNAVFVGLSVLISYPMTMSYSKDISWFGYALSVAAIVTLIADRLYLYSNKTDGVLDREKYQLFAKSFDSGFSFLHILKFYFPAVLQGLSEWLPSLLTTFVIASKDSNGADEAQVPSVQIIVALTQILQALGAAATILVSEKLGKAEEYKKASNLQLHDNMVKNAELTAYAMSIVSLGYTSLAAIPCIIYPDPVVKLFCHNEELLELSNSMLRTTCATLLVDGVRNVLTGALLGRKYLIDSYFASVTNLTITASASTLLGVFTQKEMGALSLFIWKALAITVSTGLELKYWAVQAKSDTSSLACLGICAQPKKDHVLRDVVADVGKDEKTAKRAGSPPV